MSVREGMDVERVRSIAAGLGRSGEGLRALRDEGSSRLRVLQDAWSGPDLDGFGVGWETGAASLEGAADSLVAMHRALLRQAGEQEATSDAVGGGGRGPGWPDRPGVPDVVPDDVFDDLFGGGFGGGWDLPDPFGGPRDAWDRGTDTVEDAWDWAGDRGDDLAEWGRGGLDWLGDRGDDLAHVARGLWDDEVLARWDAGVEALARLGPSVVDVGEQLTQVFTEGRWPRFHEVLASGLLLAGRTAGLGVNLLTGEDHRILESGDGVVTSRHELTTSTPDGRGRVPTDLDALMDIQSDTYDSTEGRGSDNRHVRVTEVVQPDGTSAYVVTVPGTSGLFDFPGSVAGGDDAFDNTSNLELQAGRRSASMEAVMAAMAEAGIPADAPVMLQGHSQGGMVTGELVQDPEFMDRYDVTHMITQGSPNDSRSIPEGVRTLAIEHTNDIVPMVDLGDALAGPPVPLPLPGPLPTVVLPMIPIPNLDPALAGSGDHVTQVRVDPNPGVAPLGVPDAMNAHHYDQYADTVRREIAAGNRALTDYAASAGIDVFLTDDPGSVRITEYGTGRR
ncbi:hypothetical protein [Janibacter sp. LM]|uniref:WXG100 family type VII secretion target n=1 Tax=Janibacter sp. LM TaxID=3144845 RepID=UPI0031F62848